MAESPFVEMLLKLSSARLSEMLTLTDEHISKLKFEREYIERALAKKQGGADSSEPQAHSRPEFPVRSPRRKGTGERRDLIRRVMETKPEAVWIPSAVRDELTAQGAEATTPAVRALMKRMMEDGELQRPGESDQGFKLAGSTNGAVQRPLVEPPKDEDQAPLAPYSASS
ncbi:MAG: hypothetical protein M3R38_28785 [Actinomycetota bacterium]|nr:hypothetical protein [Actinomycetota bacterium]